MLLGQVGLAECIRCVEYPAVPYAAAIYRRKLVNFEHKVAKHRDSQNPPQQWRLNFEVGRGAFASAPLGNRKVSQSLATATRFSVAPLNIAAPVESGGASPVPLECG
jgi:hypothetical protein